MDLGCIGVPLYSVNGIRFFMYCLQKNLLFIFIFLQIMFLSAEEIVSVGIKKHSTHAEWEIRKSLYSELVDLSNKYRQKDYIRLQLGRYREIANHHWLEAFKQYKGKVRSIPICGELIPFEYQKTEKMKEDYYNQFAWEHSNFCKYVRKLPQYDQLICTYYSVSTEIEEIQKPLRDLSPSTAYSSKNLQGRMKYLRVLIPERYNLEIKIIASEIPPKRSKVNAKTRLAYYNTLADLMEKNPVQEAVQANMDEYNKIFDREWGNAQKKYDGAVIFYPAEHEEFMPRECFISEKYKEKYLKERKGWNYNFCEYIKKLPKRIFLICAYRRYGLMLGRMTGPIRDLATDTPYPMENLYKRLVLIKAVLGEMHRLENELILMDKLKK